MVVYSLNTGKETPKARRERLRQEELKRNLTGSIYGGRFQDLIGNLVGKVQEYSFF